MLNAQMVTSSLKQIPECLKTTVTSNNYSIDLMPVTDHFSYFRKKKMGKKRLSLIIVGQQCAAEYQHCEGKKKTMIISM